MACITEEELRAQVRRLTLARLAALVEVAAATPPHSAGNLAEGWYTQVITRPDGTTYFGGERHRLDPTAALSMSGNTLTVVLDYNISIVP